MTVGLTATEIENIIMKKLQDHADCAALHRVVVTAEGLEGNWTARAETRSGITIGYSCALATIAAVNDLRREYHLAG